MAKTKYRFNPQTLNYEEAEVSRTVKVLRVLGFLGTGVVFAVVIVLVYSAFFPTWKEVQLERQNQQLLAQFDRVKSQLHSIEDELVYLQQRDDDIYRVIFEAPPVPAEKRTMGIGGLNRYRDLEDFEDADLIISTSKRLDKIRRALYTQSKSFDEVVSLVQAKNQMLASIPAIQPISNKDLTRMASGFGYRIHPVYKTRKMHTGMDFSAVTGTEIYATGDGTVDIAETNSKGNGYGKYVVLEHGYSYKTLYGHMSKVLVKPGQKVKRGDVIGLVGSTGTSVAPHLHYEVHKGGKKINPVNFFHNDLTPEEYEMMIQLSSSANQSFD